MLAEGAAASSCGCCGMNPPCNRVNGWVLAMLDLRPAAPRLCAWQQIPRKARALSRSPVRFPEAAHPRTPTAPAESLLPVRRERP